MMSKPSPVGRRIFLSSFLLFFSIHIHENNDASVLSLKLVDVRNNTFDISKISNQPILLLFFDPYSSYDKEIVSYAEVVFKRHKSKGLRIFGISNNDVHSTLALFEYGQFSFPFVSDQQETIHKLFNIKRCCGGIVLINRDKRIVFNISFLLKPENLRQLVEKEILGKINYSFSFKENDKGILLRQKLPALSFLDVQTLRVTNMLNPNRQQIVMTFLSSFCPICKSSERIHTLKQLKKEIDSKKYEARIVLVFFKPYNERDIQAWDNTLSMPFEKYIALEDIFTDEEKYVTDMSLKTDPLTIVLDRHNQIAFVERLGMDDKDVSRKIGAVLSAGGANHAKQSGALRNSL